MLNVNVEWDKKGRQKKRQTGKHRLGNKDEKIRTKSQK